MGAVALPGCKPCANGVHRNEVDTLMTAAMAASCSSYGFGLWHTVEAAKWKQLSMASEGTPEQRGSESVPFEPRETIVTNP